MHSEAKGPRYRRSLGALLVLGSVAMGCMGGLEAGCGGSGSPVIGSLDSGTDGTTPHDGAAGDSPATKDSGADQTAEDSGGDSAMADSGEDSEPAETGAPETGADTGAGGDTGSDAGGDTGTGADTGTDTGTDALVDSPTEAAPACTGAETKCTTGTTAGLCVSGACLPCNSPADNANCTTAYGAGTTSYVCDTAGSCVAGNCNVDSDCTGLSSGELCGLTTPNACGKCTTDTQCHGDPSYGPGTICDTTTGGCVASTCAAAGACSANSADFCCLAGGAADCTNGGTCACVPGNCCTSADCTTNAKGPVCGGGGTNQCGKCTLDSQCPTGDVCNTTTGACTPNTTDCTGTPPGGATGGGKPGVCTTNAADMCCATQPCIGGTGADACCPGTAGNTYCQGLIDSGSAVCGAGNVCTACAAVTGNTYIVDPVNGSDATGTGSASPVESCALKTIKRALTLIGTPTAATTIQVVGGATGPSTASGETFPIVVPTNVTITTKPASGAVTVTIPAGVAGFTMNSPASAIQGNTGASLTITTTANGATDGVVVGGTAGTGGATTLANVSITGMLSSGILVNAGVVTINAGVVSNDNGTATSAGHGLDVEAGEAIVTGGATAATTFNGNSAHGILVEGTGLINLTGAVTTANPGVGTVETNGNVLAGVWMQQTPGAVTLTSSTITGLVSFGNTGGNGMHIVVGSRVTVRGSVFLGNKVNGVNISGGNGVGTVDSMAGIDLGNTTTNGANTFQAPMNQGNNEAAGICIDVANGQAALLAVGNQFQATNCATTAATLYLNATTCTNSVAACATGVCDLGLTNPVAGPVASNNSFNVSKCTQ